MKFLPIVLFASLLLTTACGDKAANAANMAGDATNKAMGAVGDLTKQTAVFDKLKGSVGDLTKTLTGITDGATAEKAKGALEGLVGTLKGQMGDLSGLGALAGNLGDMKGPLVKGATDQIAKLLGNADIMKAIGPVLEQLKGALGAK